jgi:hypothetical protein
MTQLLSSPRPSPLPAPRQERRPLVAGVTGALWAAVTGALLVGLPVLAVEVLDARSTAGVVAALRAAGQLWLAAHGAGLVVDGVRLGLVPLGLLLVPLLLLVRAGRRGAQRCGTSSPRGALALVATAATVYGVVVAAVALTAQSAAVSTRPAQAALAGTVLAATGSAVGLARAVGSDAVAGMLVTRRLGSRPLRLLRATTAAVCVLLAGGALLAGAALALHLHAAAELSRSTAPGVVGGAALLVTCLALLPNAVVWGAAWLAGPGFAVGAGTTVGPFAHELGPVPALPLLAALPADEVPTVAGLAALAVPLVAGLVAGTLVQRSLGAPSTTWRTVREAALAGPGAGVAMGLLVALSGGSLGSERLSVVGPAPGEVALAVTVAVSAGAVVGALCTRWRQGRSLP